MIQRIIQIPRNGRPRSIGLSASSLRRAARLQSRAPPHECGGSHHRFGQVWLSQPSPFDKLPTASRGGQGRPCGTQSRHFSLYLL
jgi:hypothetical protein